MNRSAIIWTDFHIQLHKKNNVGLFGGGGTCTFSRTGLLKHSQVEKKDDRIYNTNLLIFIFCNRILSWWNDRYTLC